MTFLCSQGKQKCCLTLVFFPFGPVTHVGISTAYLSKDVTQTEVRMRSRFLNFAAYCHDFGSNANDLRVRKHGEDTLPASLRRRLRFVALPLEPAV